MKNELLQQIGLSEHQITIYTTLMKYGPQKAGTLTKKTDLKRGLVYKTLEDLVGLELIEKDENSGAVTLFTAKHPSALKDLADKKARNITRAQKSLEDELGPLVSAYNLATGKPGIEFYEGKESIEKVLNDTLLQKGEIYTYADIQSVEEHIKDVNAAYVEKRKRLRIQKKALILDTPFAQKHMQTYFRDVTDTRFISNEDAPPFKGVMEIYDGKIAYITFEKDTLVGMIIQDHAIYSMHKYLFEFMWKRGKFVH